MSNAFENMIKLYDMVSVTDFGAKGDGVTNDRAAVQAAFNASKRVYFPSGTYWMGSYSTSENIIDLSALGAGISIITDKSVEFVCQTTGNVIPRFFYLFANSHFSCGPIRFRDTGYDPLVTWRGAYGFFLESNASTNWGDVTFESIYGNSMVGVVAVAGGNASNRIRGIHIGQLFSDNCYYGFNAQNQGDGVQIDNLIAFQNYRPYFVYGVSDHKVKIFNRANRGASGAVSISRSPGGLNTTAIDVSYVARDQTQGITHVLINHIDLLGGTISDIKVHVDIESSTIYTPVRFVNYSGSGGSETSAASTNIVKDVTLSGTCDVQANPVSAVASYANATSKLIFIQGSSFNIELALFSLFSVNTDISPISYTPTWASTGTQPAIGNGSLSGYYSISGGMCMVTVELNIGSTTTTGTGQYSFSLPFASPKTAVGSYYALDNGVAHYAGSTLVAAGNSTLNAFTNGSAAGVGASAPFAWASGDYLRMTLTYSLIA